MIGRGTPPTNPDQRKNSFWIGRGGTPLLIQIKEKIAFGWVGGVHPKIIKKFFIILKKIRDPPTNPQHISKLFLQIKNQLIKNFFLSFYLYMKYNY